MFRTYVVSEWLLYLNLRLSSGKLADFSDIFRDCGALMFLVEPKGGGRGSCVSLFYCLIVTLGCNTKKTPHVILRIFVGFT
jgi:hypothetical protein